MTTTPKPNGGPAFPMSSGPDDVEIYGMTLRDWFAGQALTALGGVQFPENSQGAATLIANIAYAVADAMIAAREAGQ